MWYQSNIGAHIPTDKLSVLNMFLVFSCKSIATNELGLGWNQLWSGIAFFYTIQVYNIMQEPPYRGNMTLVFRMVLTQVNLGIRIFSHLDIPTKCQYLTGIQFSYPQEVLWIPLLMLIIDIHAFTDWHWMKLVISLLTNFALCLGFRV